MKLIDAIRERDFFEFNDLNIQGSCSIVGNSGAILKNEFGSKIDSNDFTIRFNGARTDSYEKSVGNQTDFRILNCHYILNVDNESYFKHQQSRFPEMDRFFLYNLYGENIIFKTDPSWRLWDKKEILKKVLKNNNKIYFVSSEIYNLGKRINGGNEPTNGFIGLMFGLKYFDKIDCFGFSFYEGSSKEHYYEEINCDPKGNHNFEREKKVFTLLDKNNIIKMF
jgi:hypothetical protein